MISSSDKMCKANYDSVVAIVLIVFSLFNIIYICIYIYNNTNRK